MLTVNDIRNPKRKSGFDHVNSANSGVNGHGHNGDRWRAELRTGPGSFSKNSWRGPTRRTSDEAAQDYCDYKNGLGASAPATLNYPQRPSVKRDTLKDDPEVAAALGVLKDARAQRQGKQGYIYCIGVKDDDYAVKIGYSTNPVARVKELQTGNPRELVLVATMKGTEADEKALHQRHIKLNLLGEWFRKAPSLINEFGPKNKEAKT